MSKWKVTVFDCEHWRSWARQNNQPARTRSKWNRDEGEQTRFVGQQLGCAVGSNVSRRCRKRRRTVDGKCKVAKIKNYQLQLLKANSVDKSSKRNRTNESKARHVNGTKFRTDACNKKKHEIETKDRADESAGKLIARWNWLLLVNKVKKIAVGQATCVCRCRKKNKPKRARVEESEKKVQVSGPNGSHALKRTEGKIERGTGRQRRAWKRADPESFAHAWKWNAAGGPRKLIRFQALFIIKWSFQRVRTLRIFFRWLKNFIMIFIFFT